MADLRELGKRRKADFLADLRVRGSPYLLVDAVIGINVESLCIILDRTHIQYQGEKLPFSLVLAFHLVLHNFYIYTRRWLALRKALRFPHC